MIRLAALMVLLQGGFAVLLMVSVLSMLANWIVAGVVFRAGEVLAVLSLALTLGGTAWLAWRWLEAERVGAALLWLGLIWALGLVAVLWAASTARWN